MLLPGSTTSMLQVSKKTLKVKGHQTQTYSKGLTSVYRIDTTFSFLDIDANVIMSN